MRTPSPAPRKVINITGGTWVRKRAFWSGRGIIPFDQPVPGSPDSCPPPPRPSKKGEHCRGEGSPGWPPLDTRLHGSAAQGPPRAPSADPSINARALASLLQGSGEAHAAAAAAAASRAGTQSCARGTRKPNGLGPCPRGRALEARGGRRPVPGEPEGRHPRRQLPAPCGTRASTASARGNLRAAEGRSPPLGGEKAARARGRGGHQGVPLERGASPPQPQASVWSGNAGPRGQPLA